MSSQVPAPNQGNGPWQYDGRFRDMITRLLAAPGRTERPVEAAIPEALRSLMLCAPVHVVWRGRDELLAASCPDLLSPGRAVSEPARIQEIVKLSEPLGPTPPSPGLVVRCTAREGSPWGIHIGVPREDGHLIIVLEGAPQDPNIVTWLSRYAQGLLELYSAVKALMALRRVQRDAEHAQLSSAVREIVSGSERSFADYLREAGRLVTAVADHREAPDSARVSLVQDLAIWAAQALLGVGWGGRTLDGPEGQATLDGFCAGIERVAARGPVHEVGHLYCLSGILRAALPTSTEVDWVDRTLPSSADPSLRLLVTWTALHEMARRVSADRAPATPREDARWESAARGVLAELGRVLEDRTMSDMVDVAFVRNWARLWFCHLLLRTSMGARPWWQGALLDDEKWRFRCDIAYVVRESIRFAVYGRRDDYKFQPVAFADALRTLVEQHALKIVGLARDYDIRGHLREVGEYRSEEGYHFAAGHLQHLLEMYIGGHFLLSICVAAPVSMREEDKGLDGWSMAEVLASRAGWRPGTQSTLEFLQAFSLAALFHDTGMLIFPRYTRPSDALCRGDDRLTTALGHVEGSFQAAGSALVQRCVEDLRGADYLDASNEPGLARWLEDQISSGTPDHGLLGAWYLYRASRAITSTPAEVVREALRAVLLHSLPALPIDVEREPVAGILALCDELFEWEPFTRPGPLGVSPARSMMTMAADVRPKPSRVRRLRLPGLTVRMEPDGALSSWLALKPEDYSRGWPAIELRLHSPERLERPLHFIWLTMAQNLGRVERSRHGWGPRISLISPIPLRLRAANLYTRRMLGQLAAQSRHPARVSLERWLEEIGIFEVDESRGSEVLVLEARNHVLHGEDIRRAFSSLGADIEQIVREFERRNRG